MPETSYGVVTRVGLRVLVGFGVYGVLCGLWLAAGLDEVYDGLLRSSADALLPLFTHFPVGASTASPLVAHNQGYVLVLLASLFVVAGRLRRTTRSMGYLVLGIAFVASQVLGLALQLHLDLALKFQANNGLALLLPWELEILRRTIQLLFVFGLQIAPFLAVVLTAFWLSGRELTELFSSRQGGRRPDEQSRSTARGKRPGFKRLAIVSLVCLSALISVAATAWWQRETDPRHVRAHIFIGDVFFRRVQLEDAERQYRAAIRGGTRDGRIWVNLAGILRQRGEHEAAARTIQRGLRVVSDPMWRRKLEDFRPTARPE